MPARRTPINRQSRARITPEAIALFRLCREISAAGMNDTWEDDGGRRREYSNASVELHRMLGRKLWEENVLDAARPESPDHITDPVAIIDYKIAHDLWCQLYAAAYGHADA